MQSLVFPIDTEVIDTIGGLKETIRQKKKEITTSQRRIKLFLAMKNNSWLPNDDPAVLKLARGRSTKKSAGQSKENQTTT